MWKKSYKGWCKDRCLKIENKIYTGSRVIATDRVKDSRCQSLKDDIASQKPVNMRRVLGASKFHKFNCWEWCRWYIFVFSIVKLVIYYCKTHLYAFGRSVLIKCKLYEEERHIHKYITIHWINGYNKYKIPYIRL